MPGGSSEDQSRVAKYSRHSNCLPTGKLSVSKSGSELCDEHIWQFFRAELDIDAFWPASLVQLANYKVVVKKRMQHGGEQATADFLNSF
jgi:hypothetical protein